MQAKHLWHTNPGFQSYGSNMVLAHATQDLRPLVYRIRSLGVDEALTLRHECAGEIQDVASMKPGSEIVLPLRSSYLDSLW
jgi:hypothetical protein